MADTPLSQTHPGGCYLFFNAEINPKSIEQLLHLSTDGIKHGFQRLTLCISSAGGDPDSAVYAFNALSALPIQVNTHNVSAVQSAAVTLFLAGVKRTANPNSFFFFHQTACPADSGRPTKSYLTERMKIAQQHDKRAAQIVADKTGGTIERVHQWQRAELYMSAGQAIAEKLIEAATPLSIPKDAFVGHVLT